MVADSRYLAEKGHKVQKRRPNFTKYRPISLHSER